MPKPLPHVPCAPDPRPQKRRQQFALLLHVIDELQRATDDGDEGAGGGGEEGPTGMEVDA